MNMIFNASAGTGKTWQVTELYCALVLGTEYEHLPSGRKPVPPEKILLMTFTDNAAAELRERVASKMIAAEKSGNADQEDLARSMLRRLPVSNISTIHAFCAGLLREHALELGLSPSFQTLEDEERDALLEEVLKAELFQTLESDAAFRTFCEGISVLGDHEFSLIRTIRSLLEKADSRGLDLSQAEAMLPPPSRTVTRQMFERIHDELDQPDLPKTAVKALDALKVFLADFPSLEKLGGIGKFGQAKKVKHLSDELAELKERFKTEVLYEQNIEKFQSFSRCLSRCSVAFAEAKRARDAVDFGDQLLLARDLLKVRPFDAPPFEWMIVDEVQDTSRVQCEVIEALWGERTNLVVCGDKKQSIYAWRSADPDVMPDLETEMEKRGDCNRVDLKKSYRSKDRVIDAVNGLFDGIYSGYDALEPQGTLTGEKPCVEFLMPDEEEQGSDEEMKAVARRIRLLVEGGEAWRPKFGHDGQEFVEGELVRYGDILILLKRSTNQSALETALRSLDIPFSSGGKGKALFEQQEVRDLLLFLQVVTQPENDLALVGFLRSPFVSISDDEIVKFGWDGQTFDHEILRRQFFETEQAQLILRYREQIGRKLPSQLVREIVSETAFDAHLAGQPGGEQKLANFKKALDWLRAAERGGQTLIGDVVRRFEKAIKTPPKSGAAEALLPDPDQNSVTIMTVHSAKGLTKRVCFVPDISFGDVTEPGFAMFSPEGSLELSVSNLTGDKVVSPNWTVSREADKAVRAVESKNVFYVAMTRARDLVVLSGAGTRRVGGWLKLSEAFLENASTDLLRKINFAQLPEFEVHDSESRSSSEEICFQPLKIPAGLGRRAVSSLCEKRSACSSLGLQASSFSSQISNPSLYGTVGHAVLEELAKKHWAGDIAELVQLFMAEFGQVESEVLIPQLEAARDALRAETSGAKALFTEHSFVLMRDKLILDGSIDLLVEFHPSNSNEGNNWRVLDYKFSDESPERALEAYTPQLAAYKEAIEALHPDADVSAALVLIRETIQIISLHG